MELYNIVTGCQCRQKYEGDQNEDSNEWKTDVLVSAHYESLDDTCDSRNQGWIILHTPCFPKDVQGIIFR